MSNYRYNKGSAAARDLLDQNGFESLLDFPLELFASGLGATVIEKPLLNSDGRIIFGKKHTVIEINQNIEFLKHDKKVYICVKCRDYEKRKSH